MSRKKNWEKKKKFSKGKQIKKDKFKLKKRDLREFEKQGLIKEGTFIGSGTTVYGGCKAGFQIPASLF